MSRNGGTPTRVTEGMDYAAFLAAKTQYGGADGFEVESLPSYLFPFQEASVRWGLGLGRAAIFADCGLGKTPMQLAWAQAVHLKTGKPVLIATPLAVSYQTQREAVEKFGLDAAVSRDGSLPAPITITNYERLHLFDTDALGGVVCDESSAIKAFDGVRRAIVTEFMRQHRYRLLCTATAAPNDYIELGTSSEALGQLGYMDMLGRFFVNDQHSSHPMRQRDKYTVASSEWRFKGHAEDAFWRWVGSWARAFRKPSDIGFSDEGFALPALLHNEHVVSASKPRNGTLFDLPAVTMQEQRQEDRHTIKERCVQVASLVSRSERAVAWCHLNDEGELLTRLIPGSVQIKGSDDADAKEEALIAFSKGDIRVLVTKPSIAGWGLNWQHCHHMTFFPSHSYEQYYQAVRRCWRFGQTSPVTVDIVTTAGGINVLRNLERKASQADRMFDALTAHMRDALSIQRTQSFDKQVEVPSWLSATKK